MADMTNLLKKVSQVLVPQGLQPVNGLRSAVCATV